MTPSAKGRLNDELNSHIPKNSKKSFKDSFLNAFKSTKQDKDYPLAQGFFKRTLTLILSFSLLIAIPFINKINEILNTYVNEVTSDTPYSVMPISIGIMLFALYGSFFFFISYLSNLKQDGLKPIFHEKLLVGIAKCIKPITLTGNSAYLYFITLIAFNVTLYVGFIYLGFGDVTNPTINPDFSKGDGYLSRSHLALQLGALSIIPLVLRLTFNAKDISNNPYEGLCAVVIQLAISFGFIFSIIRLSELSTFNVPTIIYGFFSIILIASIVLYVSVCVAQKHKFSMFDAIFKSGIALFCYCIGLTFFLSNHSINKSSQPSSFSNTVEVNGKQFNYRLGGRNLENQDNYEVFFEAFDGNSTISYQLRTVQLIPHAKGQAERVVRNIANYSLTANEKLIKSKSNVEIIKQEKYIESPLQIMLILQMYALDNHNPASNDFFELVKSEKYQEAIDYYINDIVNSDVSTERFTKTSEAINFKIGAPDLRTIVELLVSSGMAHLDENQIENQDLREKVIESLKHSKLAYDSGKVKDGDITKEEFETIMVF